MYRMNTREPGNIEGVRFEQFTVRRGRLIAGVAAIDPFMRTEGETALMLERRILELNGYSCRIPYKLFLLATDENPALKEAVKGRWFRPKDDRRLPARATLNTPFNWTPIGRLVKHRDQDPERTIGISKGPFPLTLAVLSDEKVIEYGRRFILYCYDRPDEVAPLVVGIKPAMSMADVLRMSVRA